MATEGEDADFAEVVLSVTDISTIPEIVARTRAGYRSLKTIPREYREHQLRQLKKLLEENEKELQNVLWHDLKKDKTEGIIVEVNLCVSDIVIALNNLDKWMAPEYAEKDLLNKFNTICVQPEPYGLMLIMSPWNYPLQLALLPLVGAIAAGNACILKPSEFAVASSNLLAKLIPQYLDNECYAVVTGAVDVGQALLQERWDYIMYTGSTSVGKIVMRHAAEHITPVLLELGGKSPCIVADDANIRTAGRRIAFGKLLNIGQTCIAPDYVLCSPRIKDQLVKACTSAITEFYGEDPQESEDLGRIINDRHFERIVGLLDSTTGQVVYGGKRDKGSRYISPTLITDVSPDDQIMKEEIFGPLLPFYTVNSIEEAIQFVNEREKPLAFYVFTENYKTFESISRRTSSGAVLHNDTIVYAGVKSLPFGGVGYSGLGAYHGKTSFDTFSHHKPVMSTGTGLEALNSIRYPPHSETKLKRLKWLLSPSERKSSWSGRLLLLIFILAAIAVAVQVFGLPKWLFPSGNI